MTVGSSSIHCRQLWSVADEMHSAQSQQHCARLFSIRLEVCVAGFLASYQSRKLLHANQAPAQQYSHLTRLKSNRQLQSMMRHIQIYVPLLRLPDILLNPPYRSIVTFLAGRPACRTCRISHSSTSSSARVWLPCASVEGGRTVMGTLFFDAFLALPKWAPYVAGHDRRYLQVYIWSL